MAKINPNLLRAEMLASVRSIEGYLQKVKEYIRTAETGKIDNNCSAIEVELNSIKRKSLQLSAI